jgi:hypothetical protein
MAPTLLVSSEENTTNPFARIALVERGQSRRETVNSKSSEIGTKKTLHSNCRGSVVS